MRNLFAADSRFMMVLSRFVDIVVLSFLFLICCIPVVTLGAAWSALYYSGVKGVRYGFGYAWKEFFHSLKDNIVTGLLTWILMGGVEAFLIFSIAMVTLYFKGAVGAVLIGCYMALFLLILAVMVYVFPILSRFTVKTGQLLKMSLIVSVVHAKQTILLVLLVITFAALMVVGWTLCPIFLFVAPGAFVLISSYILEPILAEYTTAEQEDREETTVASDGDDIDPDHEEVIPWYLAGGKKGDGVDE